MNHERLKEALWQGEEREAARLMRELLHRSVRLGLYEAMADEVEPGAGRSNVRIRSAYCAAQAASTGWPTWTGGEDEIVRPWVLEKDGVEVRLATYEAASSAQRFFDHIVAVVAQGLPVRRVERAMGKAVCRSEASRMWVEKSREQLELLRERPLEDTD